MKGEIISFSEQLLDKEPLTTEVLLLAVTSAAETFWTLDKAIIHAKMPILTVTLTAV